MSNILILHSGLKGMTNACLEIANRLIHDGHGVFTGTIKNIDDILESNNLNTFPVPKNSLDFDNIKSKLDAQKQRKSILKNLCFDKYYDEFEFSEFQKEIERKQIKLLLLDVELHEYIIYASTKNIPFILLSQWFSLWQSSSTMPLSSSKKPSSSFHTHLSWTAQKVSGYFKTLANNIKSKGINRRNFLLHMASKFSFDTNNLQSFTFPLPFTINHYPVLSTTHPGLEFDTQSRTGLEYIYPMVSEERKEAPSNQFETDLKAILKSKTTSGKRLLVVTYSTMNVSVLNIKTLLQLLSELRGCITIVSLGAAYKQYKELSRDNLFLYQDIPQLAALKHADLSINHGGIHTINECIHFKIPMLIISGKKYDQNGCAARVREYGCGIAHFETKMSKAQLRTSISSLLNDRNYKHKIEELNKSYSESKRNKSFEKHIKDKIEAIA